MKELKLIRPQDKKEFRCIKNHDGWHIVWHDTNACALWEAALNDPILMWNDIEPFDSMIKAYRFMKENLQKLL